MSRLTIEAVRELAWNKGWDFFPVVRRGWRYSARPASWAIFSREQSPYVFGDLAGAFRFFGSAAEPIACRVDYDFIRWQRSRRLQEVAA